VLSDLSSVTEALYRTAFRATRANQFSRHPLGERRDGPTPF
jgi:hypothetical protein